MLISSTEKRDYKSFLFMAIIILLLMGIMLKPTLAINSARNGLNSWFNILLPSLFPFMILSDILLSSGYVDHFGRFLSPLTRLLFNLPGPAAFPILISSISGYPMGPRLASKLRKDGLITQGEANRLISFVATSGPLFILGSVGIGILNMYEINFLLLGPHYLSSLTIGLAFRFFQNRQKETFYLNEPYRYEKKKKPFLSHNQPLAIGKTLTNSVKTSINSILLVGGFVILYSVVIEILLELKIFLILLKTISKFTGFKPEVVKGILTGLVEITKGCHTIGALEIDFIYKIIIINFIIAWGGFSIHSQSISFISETDISQIIYIFSKFFHGLLTIPYTYIIYKLLYKDLSIPSYSPPDKSIVYSYENWMRNFKTSLKLALLISVFFVLASILTYSLRKTKKEA